jgi:hypothetical protein
LSARRRSTALFLFEAAISTVTMSRRGEVIFEGALTARLSLNGSTSVQAIRAGLLFALELGTLSSKKASTPSFWSLVPKWNIPATAEGQR